MTIHISIRLVKVLYPTRVTPNQISWAGLFAGILSAMLFYHDLILWGAVCFEVYYILDAVDGQLARARGVSSQGGAFLDEWGNFIVPPMVLFGLGARNEAIPPWVAFLAAFSVLSVSIIGILKDRFIQTSSTVIPSSQSEQGISLSKKIYSMFYRTCTMPVMMNLVTLVTILTLCGVTCPLFTILISYYALVGTAVWFTKGWHTIRTLS